MVSDSAVIDSGVIVDMLLTPTSLIDIHSTSGENNHDVITLEINIIQMCDSTLPHDS